MKDVKEILDSLASSTPSRWREKAEWRRANRQWLRISQCVALTIIECMRSKKITQKQLSKKMNVSQQYISRILKGSENLSLETISKIENALEIEILTINSYTTQQTINTKWQYTTNPKFEDRLSSKTILSSLKAYSNYYEPIKISM